MSNNAKTITGRLTDTERIGLSRNGNPSFRLTVQVKEERPNKAFGIFHTQEFRTETDGSIGYSVENFRTGREVILTLTRAGRVTDMTYADGSRA